MRKHNEQTLKSVIGEFLKSGSLKEPYIQSTIERAWKRMMGPVIVNYTDEIRYANSKLTIKISSASLRQDLWINREKIKTRLNEIMESEIIEEITIR